MAQRSLLTGALVVGIAASALHSGGSPELPVSGAAAQSVGLRLAADDSGSGSSSGRGWSERLDEHPRKAGRDAALEDLSGAICGFIGLREVCSFSAPAPALSPAVYASHGAKVPQVMIAVVPDPIHTHLALSFDRAIDALEDGLQDSGWQYQDYWLPWQGHAHGKTEAEDLKKGQERRRFDEGREQSPGVLLFRPDRKDRHKPLIIFLVAESPTSGINSTQFREAVRFISILAPEQEQLKILGPSFTGSGPSLRLMLTEAKQSTLKDWPVTIASGSISDSDCGHLLESGEMQNDSRNPNAGKCGDAETPQDTFVSFDPAFNWETQQTEEFLKDKGGLKDVEIAELTEGESGFGELNTSSKEENFSDGILRLVFPRNISHLRSAYQKKGIWGFGSTGNANSASLTLNYDEPYDAEDSVANFAGEQTPVSQEGSMGQIAATLEQRHIKAVLLSATDVMDELFVAQMLARQAPTATVVVQDSDLLFLRSGGGVHGNVYAVSAWPLIPKNRYWSRPKGDRTRIRLFPNQDAEGLYNATLYLFDEEAALQDYSSPVRSSNRPPMWFSAVGHGAYWPLALLTDSGERRVPNLPSLGHPGQPQGVGAEREADLVPRPLLFAILIVLILSVLHAGKCLDWGWLGTIARARYSLGDDSMRIPKLWLQLALSVLGILSLCLLAVPANELALRAAWPLPIPDVDTATLPALGVILLSLAASQVCWKLHNKEKSLEQISKQPVWGWILGTLAFLAASCLIWIAVWSWITPRSTNLYDGLPEFFFLRSMYPLSGSSPTLPLLLCLGGIALALFTYLGRFTFGAALRPRLPEKVDCIPNFPTEKCLNPVAGLLAWPKEWKTIRGNFYIPAVAFVAVLTFGATMRLAPYTFEGPRFKATLAGLMFVVLFVLLRELLTSAILWRRLKQVCLDPLESSPLRRGFSAIGGINWTDLWLVPQSIAGQYRILMRALEQAGRGVMAGDSGTRGGGELRDANARIWKDIDDRRAPDVIAESFKDLQQKVATTAETTLQELCDCWTTEVGRITASDSFEEKKHIEALDDEEKRSASDRRLELKEEWVALVYIHYVRLVLLQIRSRFVTAAILYLVLVWAATSYPYINRHALMVGLIGLFGALAVIVVWTYGSINRDPILSRTTEHAAGKLDIDFYLKTASMVGIPLLGLIASQFPEIANFLFSWIQPGMSAVR